MDLGFRGEIVDFYHHYRRGYPPAVIDELVHSCALTADDIVLDLGCGTGQLTLPMAGRVRAVVGLDPEADMLLRARRAAAEQGLANLSWALGADTDIAALGALLGRSQVGAVTIGQALHWMNPDALFPALAQLVRPGGGVAVVTNGAPLWLQEAAWSHALRDVLESWFGAKPTASCGTDDGSQRRYRDSLSAAGFDVSEAVVEYKDELDLDHIVGGVFSALSPELLPKADQRPRFAEQVGRALAQHAPFTEQIRVRLLMGRVTTR